VPIIRRNNCIYATSGICQCVWMTAWYAYQTVIQRVTNTKCRIDTVISPDDGHIVTWQMALFTRLCTSLCHRNNLPKAIRYYKTTWHMRTELGLHCRWWNMQMQTPDRSVIRLAATAPSQRCSGKGVDWWNFITIISQLQKQFSVFGMHHRYLRVSTH